MKNQDRAEAILKYWFGQVEDTTLPSSHRTEIWFGHLPEVDAEIKLQFAEDYKKAVAGEYADWERYPRGMLASIILYDQFSRHLFRGTAQAFMQDQKALDLCLLGIQEEFDHSLSLIERVFFYLPLMHAESIEMQSTSIRAFQILVNLSFAETKNLYENFLNFAVKHYEVIRRFGRFPQRNAFLGRPSTQEELEFIEAGTDF